MADFTAGMRQRLIVSAETDSAFQRKFRSSCRVLVAEDNDVNRRVLELMLSRFGIFPKIVSNGAEALMALSENKYDLWLLDCQMPEMDGFTAALRLRRQVGLNQNIPIVAITASLPEEVSQKCLEAGMTELLAKPITARQLGDALGRWLEEEEVPPLDKCILDSLAEIDPENSKSLLQEMLDLYIRNTSEQLIEIEAAAASADTNGVFQAAHRIKSSGCYFGATELSRICDEICQEAKRNAPVNWGKFILKLRQEVERAKVAIQERIQE